MTLDFGARPWGRLTWILDRLPQRQWAILGCLSTEERSLTVARVLRERRSVRLTRLAEIAEPPGHPHQPEIDLRKAERRLQAGNELEALELEPHELLEPYDVIVRGLRSFAATAGDAIVFDITCFPKRFFFPQLKMLLREQEPRDIIITYASAQSYPAGALHEDALPPEYLPLFRPPFAENAERAELLIAGLGFEAPGLNQLLEAGDLSEVQVYFPFPAPPPFFGRNWDFLRYAAQSIDRRHMSIVGISSLDVPSVFEELRASTNGGRRAAILAPFGPKPVSLAMCLFALGPGRDTAAVAYTQPKYYHPHYSEGEAADEAGPIVYAYPVRLGGRNLY